MYHGYNNAPPKSCFGPYGLIPQLLRVMQGSAISLLQEDLSERSSLSKVRTLSLGHRQ